MIERIVFYGTMMPMCFLLIGLIFYISWYFYKDYLRTKDLDYRWAVKTSKYAWLPFFLLGLSTLIGSISFVIGFEYGIMKVF